MFRVIELFKEWLHLVENHRLFLMCQTISVKPGQGGDCSVVSFCSDQCKMTKGAFGSCHSFDQLKIFVGLFCLFESYPSSIGQTRFSLPLKASPSFYSLNLPPFAPCALWQAHTDC